MSAAARVSSRGFRASGTVGVAIAIAEVQP